MHLELTRLQAAEHIRRFAEGDPAWTGDAILALVDCLVEYEENHSLPLDPVDLLLTWQPYPTASTAAADYGQPGLTEPDAADWLLDRTDIIEYPGGLLVAAF